jgi:hypothetical protein
MKLFHIPLLTLSTEIALGLLTVGLWVVVIWQLPESERASTAAVTATSADIARDRFRTETVAIGPGANREDLMQPEVATR